MSIVQEFKKYFDIKEVVSRQVYNRYGELAWQFFDPRLLAVVVWLRKGLGVALVCNNWANGGKLDERGFRANADPIVANKTRNKQLYCSAHTRGMGIDLSSGKMSAPSIRKWIREHIGDCPHPIRLENDLSAPTWVHIDVCNLTDEKLVEFEA